MLVDRRMGADGQGEGKMLAGKRYPELTEAKEACEETGQEKRKTGRLSDTDLLASPLLQTADAPGGSALPSSHPDRDASKYISKWSTKRPV